MDEIQDKLNIVNELLMESAELMNSGLLNGKSGVSIYFYLQARQTGNKTHRDFAEKLVNEVLEELNEKSGRRYIMPDFENGLAGIAWTIEYLAQRGFLEADTNELLSDVDDQLYRYMVSAQEIPSGMMNGNMGYLLYVLSRLKTEVSSRKSRKDFIFKRLFVERINQLGEHIEHRKCGFEEPYLFDLRWELPLCLILLGKARSFNMYNYKIDRILDHLTPIVLSFYPRLMSNRLYLLLGMESVLQQLNLPEWKQWAELLKERVQMSHVLHGELKDKNIHFLDGAAGLAWITRKLFSLTGDRRLLFSQQELEAKMIHSEYWIDIREDELKRRNLGLISGLTGIGVELTELLRSKSVEIEG